MSVQLPTTLNVFVYQVLEIRTFVNTTNTALFDTRNIPRDMIGALTKLLVKKVMFHRDFVQLFL